MSDDGRNDGASSQPDIVLYTTRTCPYCVRARQLLASKNLSYTELAVDRDPALRAEMVERSRRTTVPQIFIDGMHVGGCDDLWALERSGRLDELLAAHDRPAPAIP